LAKVILENVYKSFAPEKPSGKNSTSRVNVLRSINLTVEDGEFLVLVGPSGCGKSTLLRLIAGLEDLTSGNISIGSRLVNHLPPKQRDIAMVFQNYALYPHLSVYDNIAFGLRRLGQYQDKNSLENLLSGLTRPLPARLRYLSTPEKLIREQVLKVANILQIEDFLNRLPKQLSGGQKQRVALGRAIARNPQVFLMDEPLSNLDAKLRTETRSQIVKLQKELGTTTIYVTHDQVEAMTMGDRLAIINQGQIQQIASPLELYHHPANKFVAEFIGTPPMNFFTVEVVTPGLLKHPQFSINLPPTWAEILVNWVGRELILGIRPEHFQISNKTSATIPVTVDLVEALGHETYLEVYLTYASEINLKIRIPPDKVLKKGEAIELTIEADKIHLFEPETEQSLKS